MTRYIHKTNRQNSNPPAISDIEEGEICLNTFNLGTAANGFNNGRLYIKTAAGEVRRFVGLGLPGSSDPAMKLKYGGTNNTFSDVVSANTDVGADSLMVFKYSNTSNHVINKTANDKLTWNSGLNRLNINRSSAALSTVHIGGDLSIDTVNDWTTTFNSQFYILGSYNPGTSNNVRKVSSTDFVSYLPNNSIQISKLSGILPLSLGGTGSDLPSLSPVDGSILYYNSSASRLQTDSDLKWDSSTNVLLLTGGFEFDPPNDTLNNAEPIGVDSANRIVRMDYTYNQNLNDTSNVTFNKLVLDNNSFENPLIVKNLQTNNASAMVIGIDTTTDEIVKTSFYIDQNLKTDSTVNFEKVIIDGNSFAGGTLVLTDINSTSGGSALEIDIDGNVYRSSSTKRFKENITDYNKGLDTLLKLSPKYFNMINDPNKKLQAGLIAEELDELGLDEFIVKDTDDNPISINYDKLVVLLINSIKDLKNQLDLLST